MVSRLFVCQERKGWEAVQVPSPGLVSSQSLSTPGPRTHPIPGPRASPIPGACPGPVLALAGPESQVQVLLGKPRYRAGSLSDQSLDPSNRLQGTLEQVALIQAQPPSCLPSCQHTAVTP